jgi:hypothetical protein
MKRKMSKPLSPQSLNVREGGKIEQITVIEFSRHEPLVIPLIHSDLLDERHQT